MTAAALDAHIEEFLNLSDWTYADALPVIIGGHAGYQWVLLDLDDELSKFNNLNPMAFITLPETFQMIEVNIDKVTRPIFQCDHRWRINSHIPRCAYRTDDSSLSQSEMERLRNTLIFNNTACGVIDLPLAVESWDKDCPEQMAFESMEALCDLLVKQRVETFVYNTLIKMVVSNNPAVIEGYLSSSVFKDLEYLSRRQEKKRRLDLWQAIGPEVGPEECSQDGCEKLRIGLAVNCFLHQLEANEEREERKNREGQVGKTGCNF